MSARVHPLKSITAKLFYLTVGLVIFAVSLNSWQNASAFKMQLNRQMESNTISASENTGTALGLSFRNWENQLRVVVTTVLGTPETVRQSQMSSFLKANEQFLQVALYRQADKGTLIKVSSADTPFTELPSFEGRKAPEVAKLLDRELPGALGRDMTDNVKASVHVTPLWKNIKVPAFALSRRFEAAGTKDIYWGVLVIWLEPINAMLQGSTTSRTVVLEDRGSLFTSRNVEDFKKPLAFKNLDIVRMAMNAGMTSAFKGGYVDSNNHEKLGAFYRLPRFGLIVLVEEDAQVAYAAVQKIVNKTLLYGALFVLLSMFFSYVGASGVTSPLREVTRATREIAGGNFNTDLRPRMKDEVGVLATSVNTMAIQIKNLLASQVEKARVEKELETAQAVQTTLFPAAHLEKQGLVISGFSKPATECGGDWWGHFTGKDGTEYVFVADAMGHGVPAALVTAMAYSSFMTLANLISNEDSSAYSPKDLLEEFNKVLYHAVRGSISMTIFAIAFDIKRQKVTFANAGHNFPIFVPADNKDERLDKKTARVHKDSPIVPMSLSVRGTIVGVEKDITIEQQSFDLKPGDKFLLFTDGLIECKNPQGKEWGKKVFAEKIKAHGTLAADQLKQKIVDDAYAFYAGHPADDDITLVVVEYPQQANMSSSSGPVNAVAEQARQDQEDNLVLDNHDQVAEAETASMAPMAADTTAIAAETGKQAAHFVPPPPPMAVRLGLAQQGNEASVLPPAASFMAGKGSAAAVLPQGKEVLTAAASVIAERGNASVALPQGDDASVLTPAAVVIGEQGSQKSSAALAADHANAMPLSTVSTFGTTRHEIASPLSLPPLPPKTQEMTPLSAETPKTGDEDESGGMFSKVIKLGA